MLVGDMDRCAAVMGFWRNYLGRLIMLSFLVYEHIGLVWCLCLEGLFLSAFGDPKLVEGFVCGNLESTNKFYVEDRFDVS